MNLQALWYSTFGGVRKNLHPPYYAHGILMLATPRWFTIRQRDSLLRKFDKLPAQQQCYVQERVDYYNRLSSAVKLPSESPKLVDQHYAHRGYASVYFFDSFQWNRYYPSHFLWSFAPGDIINTFDIPTITKSRPIVACRENPNSVVINMDKVRHFMFFHDPIPFEKKQNRAIFRGAVQGKTSRVMLMDHFFGHPKLDMFDTYKDSIYSIEKRQQHETSIFDHLQFKYILSLEGNDVASNLKWVMNSNSLAVSPALRYETWFMEGRLVPGEHFVEIKPDCSDIIERMAYYDDHPNEAHDIIENAHEYCRQFFNKEQEKLISLMVMDKYFRMTGQL